jgi:uncharacterized membrane protein
LKRVILFFNFFITLIVSYLYFTYLNKYIYNTYISLSSNITNPEKLAPLIFGIRKKFYFVSFIGVLYAAVTIMIMVVLTIIVNKIMKNKKQ